MARDMRTTTARGYGHAHQQMRKRLAPIVAKGTVRCNRCGELIAPGAAWHLDHADDRSGYRGAAHARCNTRAGAVKGNRNRTRGPMIAVVDWWGR